MEAAVHSWLYIKGLYPAEAFVSRNLFGLNIRSIGENTLKTYVHDFFSSIEDLHNKGILHSLTLQLLEGSSIVQSFTIKLTWIMSIYTLVDNEKVVTHSELENLLSRILADFYLENLENNKEKTFQILIETVKEEASDVEEVLSREKWALVSQDTEACSMNEVASGVFKIEWGYANPTY